MLNDLPFVDYDNKEKKDETIDVNSEEAIQQFLKRKEQ